jgi:hypothetical protein
MQYAQLLNAREDFRGAACHWQAAAEIGRELTVTAAPPLDAPIEQAYAGTG